MACAEAVKVVASSSSSPTTTRCYQDAEGDETTTASTGAQQIDAQKILHERGDESHGVPRKVLGFGFRVRSYSMRQF